MSPFGHTAAAASIAPTPFAAVGPRGPRGNQRMPLKPGGTSAINVSVAVTAADSTSELRLLGRNGALAKVSKAVHNKFLGAGPASTALKAESRSKVRGPAATDVVERLIANPVANPSASLASGTSCLGGGFSSGTQKLNSFGDRVRTMEPMTPLGNYFPKMHSFSVTNRTAIGSGESGVSLHQATTDGLFTPNTEAAWMKLSVESSAESTDDKDTACTLGLSLSGAASGSSNDRTGLRRIFTCDRPALDDLVTPTLDENGSLWSPNLTPTPEHPAGRPAPAPRRTKSGARKHASGMTIITPGKPLGKPPPIQRSKLYQRRQKHRAAVAKRAAAAAAKTEHDTANKTRLDSHIQQSTQTY